MATGLEHSLLLFARVATGSVFLLVFGLVAYVVGGYVLLVETIELSYPFLDAKRDPVLNLLLALIGVGMFITSLPILLLATIFSQDGIDNRQVILTTVLGTVGLALVRNSVGNIH